MSEVTLTVNGTQVTEPVEPRVSLADFVRDRLLLTGTHIGCEQGVCGACTILIDGQPARSCTAFAIACDGAAVQTIEGLVDDPVIERLRAAFKAEHALQCGYCTPGMLVTARDIVLRLPGADEARIRVELAGNLCRCTGYAGIVRAIQRVLKEAPAAPEPVALATPKPVIVAARPVSSTAAPAPRPFTPQLSQSIRLAVPLDTAWAAVLDPALIASCVPGASITRIDGSTLHGEMAVALGPIKARFSGSAQVSYEAGHSGQISGEGRDSLSGTRLKATARFQALADGPDNCRIDLAIDYALTGALAQFSRGPVVKAFADALAADVARALTTRLTGDGSIPAPRKLSLVRMLAMMLLRWVGLK
jgi:carbon-monoxide dehydrogenase small subunit